MQQNYTAFKRFTLWWIKDQSWLPLLYQFSNDNHAYPTGLVQPVTELYEQISQTLSDVEGFTFELGLTEDENVFTQADSLSDWANQFTWDWLSTT